MARRSCGEEILLQGDREIGSFVGSSRKVACGDCAVAAGNRALRTPKILALPISRSPCEISQRRRPSRRKGQGLAPARGHVTVRVATERPSLVRKEAAQLGC